MTDKNVDATARRRVELAVSELDSLSVPPHVAVQYLSKLFNGRFSPASIADLAECEPPLAAALLHLAQRYDAGPARQRHAIRLVLDRLDAGHVRDTLLGTKVSAAFEIQFAEEPPAVPSHRDLTLHSLAVACSARRLAEASPWQLDPMLAYSAGLLHDLGKYALLDLMPRSLAAIAAEAKATAASLQTVEQRRLGTDHTLLGKHLAQRWRLPEAIQLAIWLHHSDSPAVSEGLPQARIALVVRAADHIARRAGLGQSGSFDPPEPLDVLAEMIDLPSATLREIGASLPDETRHKADVLGLDTPNAIARYCDLIQASAAELSRTHTQLSQQSRELQTASGYLTFAGEFLRTINAGTDALSMAEDFARRWQRFFQTGSVCIYLPGTDGQTVVDAVVVEALGHSRRAVLEVPADAQAVPPAIASRFALIEARDQIDWVLEQLEVDFERGRTRLLPLLSAGQTVAIVAFELNYPGDLGFFAERFEMAAAMGGAVLGLARATERQQRLLEQLAQVRTKSKARPAQQTPAADPFEALAEMAAGVAHELNNPLSVIAGRAQLLAQAETDGQKRHVLDVIQENAREASGVMDDLMGFAQPSPPRATMVDIHQIIEEAVELAGRKTKAEHVNTQIQIADEIQEVFVDSGQVVSAIANIIANAIESYTDAMGPIKIVADPTERGVRLEVRDLGAGMDAETLRKALHPFFSAKPAGRKRGMGLSYAARLIDLNHGSLHIESHRGEGTTVAITLPYE